MNSGTGNGPVQQTSLNQKLRTTRLGGSAHVAIGGLDTLLRHAGNRRELYLGSALLLHTNLNKPIQQTRGNHGILSPSIILDTHTQEHTMQHLRLTINTLRNSLMHNLRSLRSSTLGRTNQDSMQGSKEMKGQFDGNTNQIRTPIRNANLRIHGLPKITIRTLILLPNKDTDRIDHMDGQHLMYLLFATNEVMRTHPLRIEDLMLFVDCTRISSTFTTTTY